MKVFISHSSHDDKFVAKLTAALGKNGVSVWHDSVSLRGGQKFGQAIQQALDDADIVIVPLSQAAIDSEWVQNEIEYARGLKPIIPLRLSNTPARLPVWITATTYIDFSNSRSFDQSVSQLIAALFAAKNLPPPSPLIPTQRSMRKTIEIAAAIATIISMFLAALALAPDQTREKWFQSVGISEAKPTATPEPTGTNTPPIPTQSPVPTATTLLEATVIPIQSPTPTLPEATLAPIQPPTHTPPPVTPITENVDLLFIYPQPTYFAIRAGTPGAIRNLNFSAAGPSGEMITLAITDFPVLADSLDTLEPGTCIVFYDGIAPNTIPNCELAKTFQFALLHPTEQKFWLQQNVFFTAVLNGLSVTCPIGSANQTCQMP